jgi:hypothetical protein
LLAVKNILENSGKVFYCIPAMRFSSSFVSIKYNP